MIANPSPYFYAEPLEVLKRDLIIVRTNLLNGTLLSGDLKRLNLMEATIMELLLYLVVTPLNLPISYS